MRPALFVLVMFIAVPVAAQEEVTPQLRLMHAARKYRSGDTRGAIEMLRADDRAAQRNAAREALAQYTSTVVDGRAPRPNMPAWSLELLRAAGAVHMEAALELYEGGNQRNVANAVIAKVEIGEILLDGIAKLEQRPSDARRWESAIGLQALADGRFGDGRTVLTRACQRYPDEATLLVACGTAHEAFASFNIDSSAAVRAAGRGVIPADDQGASALMRFRTDRKESLNGARNAFESAVSLDPSHREATLRLGKVLLEQGKAAEASQVLEPLVQLQTGRRTTYLSRLFLGRVRERQRRFDDAIGLFRQAIDVLPAQSGRLSLASRLHATGRNADALALAEAATSDRDIEDPWWSYHFGQYWLIEPTLEALRKEGRAQATREQPRQ